jgi:YfiH family protein
VTRAGVREFAWSEARGVPWLEIALPGARAAFSTRQGGVSAAPYDSLNLGILTADDPDAVISNRHALARALGRDPDGIAYGLQVHGCDVEVHEAPLAGAEPVPSDAQATAFAELTPLVLVADCLPLALGAPGAVAMAHCGWRGVVSEVVANAVAAVEALAGCGPEEIHCALGPGIRACCYEVGTEVLEAFERRGHGTAIEPGGRLDLGAAVRAELERCGVGAQRLADCELCTSCDPERFFSHRRDGGTTGRQAGLIWRSF